MPSIIENEYKLFETKELTETKTNYISRILK
jgi:hypothetical protein